MRKNRDAWLELLISPAIEGGTNDKILSWDNGGLTNLGITKPTLATWLGRPATDQDIRSLKVSDAREIAVGLYWNVVRADDLPGGLDVYLADFAFHSGPDLAVRRLQALLEVERDGVVGPLTLSAARSHPDTRVLVNALHASRMAFLKVQKDWKHAARGWTNRCEKMQRLALSMVESNLVEAGVKTPVVVGAGAAGLSGILLLIQQVVAIAPELVRAGQTAHAGAAEGDWAAALLGLSAAIGGAVAAYTHISRWYQARQNG